MLKNNGDISAVVRDYEARVLLGTLKEPDD